MDYNNPKRFAKAYNALETPVQKAFWLRKHYYLSLYKLEKRGPFWKHDNPNFIRFLQYLYCVLNLE